MKKLKYVNYVSINGEYVRMDSLSEEEKKEIGQKLNERALSAIGYEPVKK